ncbi:hypothetical protein LTR78_009158 [Recurvomyces mirabilis]|uniref:Uncharacterized protein n=1 Tax=Recurvomyces mirabilis TaxID=574656 RepID=A0AAE0TPP5_9PEZI|nr:hypothetical protein LTR78_009158 [Recurvomyces mirabilis]KAK5155682.1 hypothetical protein LTS14_005943 [Recurvomyces mirabilis]
MATQAMQDADSVLSDHTFLFHQLNAYPWDEDEEFQGGLRAILGSVQDPDQVERITTRAKCYYYARKTGTTVDFEGYRQWRLSEQNNTTQDPPLNANGLAGYTAANGTAPASAAVVADGGMGSAPKPATFADICDMIAEGKPIPGIKDIPDRILEGQASDASAQRRKKPWEKDSGANAGSVSVGPGGGGEKLSWMR